MSLSAAARILRAVDRLIKMVISLVKSWQIIQSQFAVSGLDSRSREIGMLKRVKKKKTVAGSVAMKKASED